MEVVAVLFIIILVYLAILMQALWPEPPAPNMSIPVQESSHQCGNHPFNELVVIGHQQPNVDLVMAVPHQNGHLYNFMHLLFLSILLCYITIYLLAHIIEDINVQEPIQCTNAGNAVSVIRGKDYPPPAD